MLCLLSSVPFVTRFGVEELDLLMANGFNRRNAEHVSTVPRGLRNPFYFCLLLSLLEKASSIEYSNCEVTLAFNCAYL